MCKIKMWELVPLPSGRKVISSKWVLKVKVLDKGFIKQYKSRLVTKHFPAYGVDLKHNFCSRGFVRVVLDF
uniref:Reverse transcriptase Ty1/copia-type domain-containing protein n=1 Tax=Peronospora matthiolae TaxID=2874970 RepID=A0AAV1VGU0_9STRA